MCIRDSHYIKKRLPSILEIDIPKDKPTLLRDSIGANFFNKLFQNHNLSNPSAIICPMQYREKFYGYLTIFSNNIYCFDIAEVELLQTLAEDLAFALNSIEVERERILAEQALSESESYSVSYTHLTLPTSDLV